MEEDASKTTQETSDESGHPSDSEPSQPVSGPTLTPEKVKEQAKETLKAARKTLARTDQAFDRTRKALQQTEEILHYNQARRERAEEQQTLRTAAAAVLIKSPLQSPNQLAILLVEDNPGDSRLFQEALTECEISYQVLVLRQGSDVLSFVHREGAFAQASHPQLIVIDLNIPGMSAEEVLAALRSVPAYQTVPVIVFSSGNELDGQQRSMQLGAQAFVEKPLDLQDFFTAVQDIVRTWGLTHSTAKAD